MQKQKLKIIFLVLVSLLTNCGKKHWGEKIPANIKTTPIKSLVDNFNELKGATVLVEGWVYKIFPSDVYLNDGTGNIALDEFMGETELFKKEISYLFDPKNLRQQKYVRIMGTLDVSRKYPLGSLIHGVTPTIIVRAIQIK